MEVGRDGRDWLNPTKSTLSNLSLYTSSCAFLRPTVQASSQASRSCSFFISSCSGGVRLRFNTFTSESSRVESDLEQEDEVLKAVVGLPHADLLQLDPLRVRLE